MKTCFITLLLSITFLPCKTFPEGRAISTITQDGEIVVDGDTNKVNLCWIEWAPKISGPWSSDFTQMSYFLVKPGHSRAVRVPFFYRVQCLGGEGVVLYLPLDGNAQDLSGNENHASAVSGTLTYSDDAVKGQSACFDSANPDFIRIPHSEIFTFGPRDSFSCVFWFNAPRGSGTEIMLAKNRLVRGDRGGIFSYQANIYKPGDTHFDVHFQLNDSSDYSVETCNGFSFVPDTWQHFAFTYSNRIMTTYVDGIPQNSETNLLSATRPAEGDLFLGLRDDGGYRDKSYTGKLDEVMIFDRALSSDEVLFHYRSHSPSAAAKQQEDQTAPVD